MNKSMLFMAGLFLVNFASGVAASTCSQETEGKQSCLSGDMMKCVKRFDPNLKTFVYELAAVNANGQTFDVNFPMYKKTAAYTPIPCTDPKSAQK